MTIAVQKTNIRPKQLVQPHPAGATLEDALAHFNGKLSFETDPADVHHDLDQGVEAFIVLDVRRKEHFEACHIPGAINLPVPRIRESTTRQFDKSKILVPYCWGPGCNGSTKAAATLSSLGFTVREMIGGIEYWRREGYGVAGSDVENAPLAG